VARKFLFTLSFCLVLCGCVGWPQKPAAMPVRNALIRDQLVIYSDSPLPTQHRMLEELCAQRAELLETLALPASNEPIHVYLFDTSERFGAFMRLHYPDFPTRRAFFVETDTLLSVYAHWGDRVAEDLRHEVAHGYLHSVLPEIPLWLDEGIAEYFEVPRGHGGYNRPHVEDLAVRLSSGWRPNLQRLEGLTSVADMTQVDYAESWAWVHMMLQTTPELRDQLRGYLNALRERGTAEPLSPHLSRSLGHPEGHLVQHIQVLISRP
jgi:hypothetical protein